MDVARSELWKKPEANEAKQGVSFEEAITVFADPLARIFEDAEHSESERREIIIGYSTTIIRWSSV